MYLTAIDVYINWTDKRTISSKRLFKWFQSLERKTWVPLPCLGSFIYAAVAVAVAYFGTILFYFGLKI